MCVISHYKGRANCWYIVGKAVAVDTGPQIFFLPVTKHIKSSIVTNDSPFLESNKGKNLVPHNSTAIHALNVRFGSLVMYSTNQKPPKFHHQAMT